MKIFYDTEFIEDGKTIDLISIGMVREDGVTFYGQNLECNFQRASDWVKANVFPTLTGFDMVNLAPMIDAEKEGGYGDWYNRSSLACHIRDSFMRYAGEIHELWAYYADYDHVALCQLYGTMMDLPKGFPMYTRDIKQLCDSSGNPKLPEQGNGEHNALADAQWNKMAYEFLVGRSKM